MSKRLRITSFNANSLRSRLPAVLDWAQRHDPDVLCVQETKVTDEDFPLADIESAGYRVAYKGQKAYNGVAIISKQPLEDVVAGIGSEIYDQEARIIRAKIGSVTVVNTYVPQGTAVGSPRFQYKLDWLLTLKDYFSRNFSPDDAVVWVGDLNIAREPVDVYDPEGLEGGVCYHPDERKVLNSLMEWGFTDVLRKHHPEEAGLYTFWDYRIPNALKRRMGWRIDYIMATRPIAELSADCWVDKDARQLEKPSDHTFITADFNLP